MSKSAGNITFQMLPKVVRALGETNISEIQNGSQGTSLSFLFAEGLWFKGSLGGFSALRSQGTGWADRQLPTRNSRG